MANANEMPRAGEAHAQIASARELRQLAHDTFGLALQAVPALPSYKAFFYDREYGDLTDAVTTDSFDAGVQLVRDRLPVQADYVVEATWTRGIGEMEVRSPRGTVVARVQPVGDTDVTVQPPVTKACTALQVGDAAPLEHLFSSMPRAA
ncbi:MAG: hypothetical protein IH627_13220 [Rubrivivax sp.]|nr:hypothetical protein [Rubrivivax sp.]